MRRALALLALAALHLFAPLAEAKYLNYTTGTDSGNALNPQAPWKTVAYANAQLPADSTIYFAANDSVLDVAINPTNPGTFWMGDSVTPANCRVPGGTINKPFTTIRGFRVVGSLSTGSTGIYAHVRRSHILGSTTLNKRGARLEYNRLGTGQGQSTFYIPPAPGDRDSFTIKNNSMHLLWLTPWAQTWTGQHLLHWQPSTYSTTMKDWVVSNNACTLTITAGQQWEKTAFIAGLRRATFSGNSWVIRDSSGLGGYGNQAFVLRDSVKECKFTNETIDLQSMDGLGQSRAFLYSSGSNLADSANVWKFCTFKSNVNAGGQPAFYNEWRAGYRDSFYRNVVVCSKSGPCYEAQGANDSAFIQRNTFANVGSGPAFSLNPDGNTASAWGGANGKFSVSGNIFYSRGGSGAQDIVLPTFSTGIYSSDYNLHFAPIPNGQDFAVRFVRWGQGPVNFRQVGIVNGTGLENASTWGSPLFEDSTYASFDADLGFVNGVASYAKATGPYGVDCGARDYVAAPPEDVADLQTQGATSNSVTLAWTAPGESGDVGTATSYDVRYSTSEITDQNFTSAIEASGEPSPSVAGTFETFTVTGLSASTTYYFAMRSSNASRSSNTSNAVVERTWPSGTIEP